MKGRHAVVTGASRGIGAATAAELARRGARVTLVGRDLAALRARGAELEAAGAEAFPVACDVAEPAAMVAGTEDQDVTGSAVRGHLAGGLQILGEDGPAGVLVEGQDADGAVLGDQRQDGRRRRAERHQEVSGRPRGRSPR